MKFSNGMDESKAEYAADENAALTLLRNWKVLADHAADHRAQDQASDEIREPMNGQGDTDSNIEGVKDGSNSQPAMARERGEYRKCHREGDGGVGRGPAPENAPAQKAKTEFMADVRTGTKGGMNAAGKCLVDRGDERTNQFGLRDGPTQIGGQGYSWPKSRNQE